MEKILIILIIILIKAPAIFSQEIGLEIGDIAPEIKLPDPKGKEITLSSTKGKVVLIDFWATWCAPCLKEQPVLSELYKQYKNSDFTRGKGFEIYGMSLDNNKASWENAIAKSKINWIQVSDLKFWTSPVAKTYNIQELPFNLLIDSKGIIIAKNLHGNELKQYLNNLILK